MFLILILFVYNILYKIINNINIKIGLFSPYFKMQDNNNV